MNHDGIRRAAVFLDRDGTIIEDRGDICHPSQVIFFRDTVPALRLLGERFDLFIVTNQSGVAKGVITMADVESVNSHITSRLLDAGVRIAATYVCPHARADGCGCIKPLPHFLRKAEKEFGIALERSFVIGDHPHDIELARNAGAKGVYVLSGHGSKHRYELPEGTTVADGIREAAGLIAAAVANSPDPE